MHKSVASIDAKIAALRLKRTAALVELQCSCKHGRVAECDYKPSDYGSALPPARVCEDCGMTEDGWGPGYQVLTEDRVRNINREELYRLRAGLMIQDRHKGPLIRREVTVQQLVRQEVQ